MFALLHLLIGSVVVFCSIRALKGLAEIHAYVTKTMLPTKRRPWLRTAIVETSNCRSAIRCQEPNCDWFRHEWHLNFRLLRGQSFVFVTWGVSDRPAFGSSFDATWFVAVGSVADAMGSDALDECLAASVEWHRRSQQRQKLFSDLHRGFETDLPGRASASRAANAITRRIRL